MKIVNQSACLMAITVCSQILIEESGRTAYQSQDKINEGSASKFIKKIIDLGYESVLEHASATFRIITDRGTSHELVRHRIASYTQESTRYCKYGNEIIVIQPPGLTSNTYISWKTAVEEAEHSYIVMLNNGITPQIARSVLPTCLKTEIVMTANFREWRHFLKLRLAPAAHPQMRELAGMIRDKLIKIVSTVFGEFKEC